MVIVERQEAVEHFVEDDAEAPPVDRVVVLETKHHFGRHVLGCTVEDVGGSLARDAVLTVTETGQNHVTVSVDEDVARLDVAVHDAFPV